MKLEQHWYGDDLLLRYRVYQRSGSVFKTYVARIAGPHPDFVLDRQFELCWASVNPRWTRYTCLIECDGVYEIVIKRYSESMTYLSRERMWLVVADGESYLYADEDLNSQFVLYSAWLLDGCKGMSA